MKAEVRKIDRIGDRAEMMRRRIRARYPILKDGAVVSSDGHTRSAGFAVSVLDQALQAIRSTSGKARLLSKHRRRAGYRPDLGIDPQSPEYLRAVTAAVDATPIPRNTDHPEIVLLAVAPRKLYAYWHLPEEILRTLKRSVGTSAERAVLVLRFYDVTNLDPYSEAANYVFDIEVQEQEERRYVEVWSADRTHRVELGLRLEDGRFVKIVTSNAIHSPRADVSHQTTVRMLRVDPSSLRPSPCVTQEAPEGEEPLTVQAGERDWPLRDLVAERAVRKVYLRFLTEGPRAIRNAPPIKRADPTLLREAYQRRQKEREATATSPAQEALATDSLFIARVDGGCEAEDLVLIREPLRYPLAVSKDSSPHLVRAEEAVAHFRAFLEARRQLRSSTRAERKRPAQPPAEVSSVLSSAVKTESRSLSDLELEAELILRGRVKPGKRVRIGGQIIETAPDGTFQVACVLRDGKLYVPVEIVEAELVTVRREICLDLGTPCLAEAVSSS